MKTYLFYDIETSGLNKAFDQVLQFAAIRTDTQLNEIERHAFTVRLRPDVIMAPRALITHEIGFDRLADGHSEYDAARLIHSLVNEPGTVSIGYNSLGFDDEFLRFMFYRNLLPPYTHQYARGCRRMDVLPMAMLYRLYNPSTLTWPELNGRPTLKLEHLTQANQLARGPAHDALVDVEATLALAKNLAASEKMWAYLEGYFVKSIDESRLNALPVVFQTAAGAHPTALLVAGEFGPEQHYQVPAIGIGRSYPYSNQTLWLRMDLPDLRETAPDAIDATTWVIRKRLGEPVIILPPLDRYWHRLGRERIGEFETNLQWLQSRPALFQEIVAYHREFSYPFIPDLDADAALYQVGFFSTGTETLSRRFHAAPLDDKATLADAFDTETTRDLAMRILGRNFYDRMPRRIRTRFDAYMKQVNPAVPEAALKDFKGSPRTTPASARAEIESLRTDPSLTTDQARLLNELERYLSDRFPSPRRQNAP